MKEVLYEGINTGEKDYSALISKIKQSDPRNKPQAQAVVAEFRAKKFEPEAYTLYSYAGVQIIKQAAEAAKSADPKKVAATMHSGMNFKTVLGDISYDKKGDITKLDYVMYI